MTIKYQSGRRIQATSTDFGTDGAGIPAVTGGWKELTRVTLGSTSTLMTTPTFANKRYYKVLVNGIQSSGSVETGLQMNGVTGGGRYASRLSVNGGTEQTAVNYSAGIADGWFSDPNEFLSQIYITNLAGEEKLLIGNTAGANTAGAGTAPKRMEWVGKFVPSPDADVSTITIQGSGTFAVGSEVVVLGWDESDTHATNFWEELASVSGAGSSTTLSSGTITAKKYLWVQVYADTATSACGFQFNNDTGANYARRYNMNGGSDGTHLSHTSANISGNSPKAFINCFIINNSANEKLLMCNTVYAPSSGAGDDPERSEDYSKWANTSSQITEIDVIKGSNWGTNSIIKVWGSN